jgi:myo-inositol 2-dehydrogenase / D-chiro-inositol 1-dehydrogenase
VTNHHNDSENTDKTGEMNVRIAIIGAGVMGADHARLFAEELPNVKLISICDASEERARTVAEQFNVANVTTDPFAAATSDDIDAVVIASPDDTHAPLTIAALRAGKHVLCEKPLSQSSQECMQVMELEQQIGERRAQIGFMRRFDPSYVEVRSQLHEGVIGKALMLHCFHRNVSAPSNFVGQMAISNSAPHEFDAARYLLNEEITAISVFRPHVATLSAQTMPVFMVLKTAAGQLVNVEVNNNASYGYDVRAEVVGERGSLFLRAPMHSEVHVDQRAAERYPADWRPRFAEAYHRQNKAWIDAIRSGRPATHAANAWDGYCAAMIAEAGVAALRSGAQEPIVLMDKPALYRS